MIYLIYSASDANVYVSLLRDSSTGTYYIRDPRMRSPVLSQLQSARVCSSRSVHLVFPSHFVSPLFSSTFCEYLSPYSRYIGPLIHICIKNRNKSRGIKRVCPNAIEWPHSRNEGSPANAQPCKLQSLHATRGRACN